MILSLDTHRKCALLDYEEIFIKIHQVIQIFIKMNVHTKTIFLLLLVIKLNTGVSVDTFNKLTVKIEEDVSSKSCNQTLSNLQVSDQCQRML